MVKIRSLLTKNIGIKIISVVIAVSLWFTVLYITNPVQTEDYRINLTIRNQDLLTQKGYIIANESDLQNEIITVSVRAQETDIALLNEFSKYISAYIDIADLDLSDPQIVGTKVPAKIYCELPDEKFIPLDASRYEIISVHPSTVDVSIDKQAQKTFSITANVNGNLNNGYESGIPSVQPQKVTISGPSSLMDQIDTVETNVDVTNATSDVDTTAAITILDKSGNNITSEFTLDQNTVKVHVPIWGNDQVPINEPKTVGTVAAGCYITSVNYSPKYVEVVGDETAISSMDPITIPPIAVNGIDSTQTYTFDLSDYFDGTGLAIKDGTPTKLTVTVNIGSDSYSAVTVPISNFSVKGGDQNYTINDGSVTFDVNDSSVSPDNIGGSIDISNLDPGTYDVPVALSLPYGIALYGSPPTVSVTIGANQTQLPTISPTQEPTESPTMVPENPNTTETPAITTEVPSTNSSNTLDNPTDVPNGDNSPSASNDNNSSSTTQ